MIIDCPECSTGFKLPDERVTSDGTKLKCSKCDHIFRVRDGGGEEPEIFYKDKDKKANADNDDSGGDDPFASAGLDLSPGKSSAFGDLDEEEEDDSTSPFDVDSDVSELEEVAEQSEEAVAVAEEESEEAEEDSHKETIVDPDVQQHSEDDEGDPDEELELDDDEDEDAEEAEEDPSLGGGSSGRFGNPEEHVDPSFGEGGEYFDPDEGKVGPEQRADEPQTNSASADPAADSEPDLELDTSGPAGPGPGGPPPGASGPPPTAASTGGPPTGGATPAPSADSGGTAEGTDQPAQRAAAPTPSPDPMFDDDLAPHNIGGSTGKKVAISLLLLSLVVIGFAGVVAYLNDGFIDFKSPEEMLEVAFADGEYTPREEWSSDVPETRIVAPTEPIEVEGVHGELVTLGDGTPLFVVQGMVRNHEDERVSDIELRASIKTSEGRTMREIDGSLTGDVAIGEFREFGSLDEIDELLGQGEESLSSGDVRPFTLVFEDLPERVVEGEHYSFGVEVADSSGGGESVASQ